MIGKFTQNPQKYNQKMFDEFIHHIYVVYESALKKCFSK